MAKVALLLPFPEMCEVARPLAAQYPKLNIMCMEYIKTEEIAGRARALEQQGCDLIIARGTQARIVKETVEVPLVEMRVTTQELGRVILQVKRDLGVETPRIGLVTFGNMVRDTGQFDDLFGISFCRYMAASQEELISSTERALADGCHAVIGGTRVCDHAHGLGLPGYFLASGAESMQEALDTAARVCYAIDLEKRNSAEMTTMLDNIFSGILQVDREGIIHRVNRVGYDLLERRPEELLGQPVTQVLPELNQKALEGALVLGQEGYTLLTDARHRALIVNLAPIWVDGGLDGALLSIQEGKRVIEMDSELRRELYQRGYIAKYTFDKVAQRSKDIAAAVSLAKRVAKFPAPVLITGEAGSGKQIMAQCIHNESLARGNAFVPLDCSAWGPDTLDNMLFGNYTTKKDSPTCLAELARDGTLYLSHVEALPMELQYKLLDLIRGRFLHNGSNRPVSTNVRVVAATESNLSALVEQGRFRADLYYAVSVLSLEVLPLRRRREDILSWVDFYLNEWQERYKRYVRLTNGARRFLQEYDWPGNLEQVNNVCERVVLLTEKRSIDEVFLRRQLEQVTPRLLPGTDTVVVYKDRRAMEIAELLRKHKGSREKVAAELGVSKTTLWRYIKKYGIAQDFSC